MSRRNPESSSVDLMKGDEANSIRKLQLGEIGTTGIKIIDALDGSITDQEEVRELQWPQCLYIYGSMEKDPAVKVALDAKLNLIIKASRKKTIQPADPLNKRSVEAANLIAWALSNLQGQTFIDVITNVCTYNRDGFSLLEKVWYRPKSGKYKGYTLPRKLSPRSQRSLSESHPWKFSEDGRVLEGVWQDLGRVSSRYYMTKEDQMRFLPRKKLMFFSWGSENEDPIGTSPLKSCFIPWREKKLLEELQVIGASKNLAGMPIIGVPSSILNKAAKDPSSDEAKSLQILERSVASMHKGHQTHMFIPTDCDAKGKPDYYVKFLGVEGGTGGNSATDLADAINRRRQAILDSFGAGFLSLGNESGGSYALMDGKTSVHEAFIQRDLLFIASVFERDLFKQILRLNGFETTSDIVPKLVFGDIGDVDVDIQSTAIQRLAATKALPVTVELVNENLGRLGYTYRVPEETTREELLDMLSGVDGVRSRSGDGMTSGLPSGVGTTAGMTGDISTD